MKNALKSKVILSIFVDFVIMVVIALVVFGSIFVVKNVLYPEKSAVSDIKIQTERMPKKFKDSLAIGDTVFDTLTKRRVGQIKDIYLFESESDVYFVLTLDAAFYPLSKALRTEKLWFYFKSSDA